MALPRATFTRDLRYSFLLSNLKIATSPLILGFRGEQSSFLTVAEVVFHRNSLQHLPAAPTVISRFAEKASCSR